MAWQIAAAALAASLIGNKIARDEHTRVAREKSDKAAAGLIERTAKADRELKPLFTKAAEDISPGKEKELLNTEDIKNLATIKQTKSRMTPLLSKGLQIGGKKSGRFTKLQSDRMGAAQSRGDLADQAMARFMSPGRVGQIRGQAVTDVGLGRTRSADEIYGDRLTNDLAVAGIQPNSGTLAFADALRIAGMMASLYNMGSSFGAEAAAGETTAGGLQAGDFSGLGDVSTTAADYSNFAPSGGFGIGGAPGSLGASFGNAAVTPLNYGTALDPFMAVQTPSSIGGSYLPSWGAPPYRNMFSDIYGPKTNMFTNMFTGK